MLRKIMRVMTVTIQQLLVQRVATATIIVVLLVVLQVLLNLMQVVLQETTLVVEEVVLVLLEVLLVVIQKVTVVLVYNILIFHNLVLHKKRAL